MKKVKELAPGIALCASVAAVSTIIVKSASGLEIMGAPVLGILAGMLLGATVKPGSLPDMKPGIAFTSKKILQYPLASY